MQEVTGLIYVELTVPKKEFSYKQFGEENHGDFINCMPKNHRQKIMNIYELNDSNY